MKDDLLKAIRAKEAARTVLPIALRLSDIELLALRSISDDDVETVKNWAFTSSTAVGIEYVLLSGGILEVYRAATAERSRQKMFGELLTELGLSESQAYRNMDVWRRAAPTFFEEPELARMFTVEAIKKLCAKSAPDKALGEGFERARHGLHISIKMADELIGSYVSSAATKVTDDELKCVSSEAPHSEAETLPITSENVTPVDADEIPDPASRRKFKGKVVDILLKFRTQPDNIDPQSILDDFITFANQLVETIRSEQALKETANV